MFGYVVPDKSRIEKNEYALYSAYYCGICKQIGKLYGLTRRLTTNYDITFFAALMFDQLDQKVEFLEQRCVGNPAKKAVVAPCALLKQIAELNMIFCFFKAEDNVIDGGGTTAKTAKRFLQKSFDKAAKNQPRLAEIVESAYKKLREYESAGESSIDRVSDCFAGLLRDCAAQILGEKNTPDALSLVYNVGKFVYLADALDDIAEDQKKGRFNPFLAALGSCQSRQDFYKTHQNTINFIMATTVNRAIESFNNLRFYQSYSMLKNIVHYGLRQKTEELLASSSKLKRPKI